METCSKISFLFSFNLVYIRIRKTSLFWLYNLMTSQWKPSIGSRHVIFQLNHWLRWTSLIICESCLPKGLAEIQVFFFQALSHNIAWKVSKINVFLRLKSWSWTSWLNPSPTNFWFFVRQCNFFLVFFLVLEKLGKLTLWNLCPFLLVQLYTLFTHYSAEILLVLSTFHFSWPVL